MIQSPCAVTVGYSYHSTLFCSRMKYERRTRKHLILSPSTPQACGIARHTVNRQVLVSLCPQVTISLERHVASGTRDALRSLTEPGSGARSRPGPPEARAGPLPASGSPPSLFLASRRLSRTPTTPAPCTSPVRRWFSQTPPSPTPTDTLGAEDPREPEAQLQPRAPPSSSWLRPLDHGDVTWLEGLPPQRLRRSIWRGGAGGTIASEPEEELPVTGPGSGSRKKRTGWDPESRALGIHESAFHFRPPKEPGLEPPENRLRGRNRARGLSRSGRPELERDANLGLPGGAETRGTETLGSRGRRARMSTPLTLVLVALRALTATPGGGTLGFLGQAGPEGRFPARKRPRRRKRWCES